MIKYKSDNIFFIIFALLMVVACNPNPPNTDFISASEYYPLQTGKYISYDVDSIRYHESVSNDTTHWQIKELIADTFYDNEQRLNYIIERYQRLNDTLSWQITNVWSVINTGNNIEKIEDNLRFIKLISPVTENVSWAGNQYLGNLSTIPVDEQCNNLQFLEGWEYNYISVDRAVTINTFSFDNTITVMQYGADNAIELSYAKEMYAKDVGMVSKEFYHYTNSSPNNPCPECPWPQKANCGYTVNMSIIDYN